jgi:hypothetical protein
MTNKKKSREQANIEQNLRRKVREDLRNVEFWVKDSDKNSWEAVFDTNSWNLIWALVIQDSSLFFTVDKQIKEWMCKR